MKPDISLATKTGHFNLLPTVEIKQILETKLGKDWFLETQRNATASARRLGLEGEFAGEREATEWRIFSSLGSVIF